LVVWVGISLIILNGAPTDAVTLRAAVLQPNYPLPAHIDFETPPEARKDTLLELAQLAADEGAEVIVMPEMGLGFDPQLEYTAEFVNLAQDNQVYLFIGYVVSNEEDYRNEVVLLDPNGQFLQVYGKNHPFGEPLGPNARTYPVYDSPWGLLATEICHDANYTDVSRKLANNGAQFIAIATREFGGFAEQAWTHYVFRAVENRTAVAHAGVAFGSTIIDPYGRILAQYLNEEGEKTYLVMDVPLGNPNTPYLMLGDWLGWVSLAGYVYFMVFMSRVKKQPES
jgi:apolipoprotein N-acyltransferase